MQIQPGITGRLSSFDVREPKSRATIADYSLWTPSPSHLHPNSATENSPSIPMAGEASTTEGRTLIGGLQLFENTLSKDAFDHCQYVVQTLQTPLLEHLKERRPKDYRNFLLTWKVLGTNNSTKQPYVVVFCTDAIKEHAEDFFRQRFARNLLQSTTTGRPTLGVVFEKSLRPKASQTSTVILGQTSHGDQKHWTMRIQYPVGADFRYAIMGGFIVVTQQNDEKRLYGMTAGHIFVQDLDEEQSQEQPAWQEPTTEAHSASFPMMNVSEVETTKLQNTGTTSAEPVIVDATEWTGIGQWSHVSTSARARNRDWALIEDPYNFGRQSYYRNVIEKFVLPDKVSGEIDTSDHIQISSEPSFAGTLARESSYAILPCGDEFVRVYALQLSGTEEMPQGFSGSWAHTDPDDSKQEPRGRTFCVYGHVVADDAFGNVYLVPLVDSLDDMKHVLDAKDVRLPTSTLEIEAIMSSYRDEMLTGVFDAYSESLAAKSLSSRFSTPLVELGGSPDMDIDDENQTNTSEIPSSPEPEKDDVLGTGSISVPKATAHLTDTTTMMFDGMRIFNSEVPVETRSRFREVSERLTERLVWYLGKKGKLFRPLTMRLLVLGHTPVDARPWLVVICPPETEKLVKKFIKRHRNVALKESNEAFDILVRRMDLTW